MEIFFDRIHKQNKGFHLFILILTFIYVIFIYVCTVHLVYSFYFNQQYTI